MVKHQKHPIYPGHSDLETPGSAWSRLWPYQVRSHFPLFYMYTLMYITKLSLRHSRFPEALPLLNMRCEPYHERRNASSATCRNVSSTPSSRIPTMLAAHMMSLTHFRRIEHEETSVLLDRRHRWNGGVTVRRHILRKSSARALPGRELPCIRQVLTRTWSIKKDC